MMMRTAGCLTFVLLLAGTAPVTAVASSTSTPPMIKAAEVAYRNYDDQLKYEFKEQSQTSQFLGNINNYEIQITKVGDSFKITFLPNKLKGHILFGGGGAYVIDHNFKIVSFTPFK